MRLYKQIRFSIVLSELHFNRHRLFLLPLSTSSFNRPLTSFTRINNVKEHSPISLINHKIIKKTWNCLFDKMKKVHCSLYLNIWITVRILEDYEAFYKLA